MYDMDHKKICYCVTYICECLTRENEKKLQMGVEASHALPVLKLFMVVAPMRTQLAMVMVLAVHLLFGLLHPPMDSFKR